MAQKFAVKSRAAPLEIASVAVPTPKPTTQSGGTSAIPMAVPAAALAVSDPGRMTA